MAHRRPDREPAEALLRPAPLAPRRAAPVQEPLVFRRVRGPQGERAEPREVQPRVDALGEARERLEHRGPGLGLGGRAVLPPRLLVLVVAVGVAVAVGAAGLRLALAWAAERAMYALTGPPQGAPQPKSSDSCLLRKAKTRAPSSFFSTPSDSSTGTSGHLSAIALSRAICGVQGRRAGVGARKRTKRFLVPAADRASASAPARGRRRAAPGAASPWAR